LAGYFDASLFDDIFSSVDKHLNEILKDIAEEHKIVYRDVRPEDITQIEVYYDSRTVDKENLEFIKQGLEKLKLKYGTRITEKKIDEMSRTEIMEIAGRVNVACMLLKISARISSQYTLGKELAMFSPKYPFAYLIQKTDKKDSVILFVRYGNTGIFYPHTPSKEMRFYQWVYPTDFIEYVMGKIT